MFIIVRKMDYTYVDSYNEEYNVYRIESDLDFFLNCFMLDKDSVYNDYNVASVERMAEVLLSDYTSGLYDKIRSYIYYPGDEYGIKVWSDLVLLYRDYKLSLLV